VIGSRLRFERAASARLFFYAIQGAATASVISQWMVSAEPHTKAAISRNAVATSSRSARWIASASRRAASRASHAMAQYSRTERICRPILRSSCSRRLKDSLDLDQVPVPEEHSRTSWPLRFDPLFSVSSASAGVMPLWHNSIRPSRSQEASRCRQYLFRKRAGRPRELRLL
jgi:hypothetical protein